MRAQCVSITDQVPYNEPFTGGSVGTPGTLVTGWTNLSGDDRDWYVKNNGTPTANTGPVGDHTSYDSEGKFMYVEATGAVPGKVAVLQSPCYDMAALSSPFLTFWYHMQGTQMGALYLDVSVSGTVTSSVWSVSGDQGPAWKQGWLNLSPYAGQTNVQFRFRAVTGTGDLSDIAIDDVSIKSTVPAFGCTDPVASNYNAGANVNNGTCAYTCPAGQRRVTVDIVADRYPSETSWTLRNGTTNAVIASGGRWGTSLCVPENTCMVFRIADSYGDGICCGYGSGVYTVTFDGAVVATGGAYGSQEQTMFNCPPGAGCTNAVTAVAGQVYTAPFTEYWYDFTTTAAGSYTVTTCGLNTCDTKLWMYDMNCNAITLSSGVEGATFADDDLGGCGQQARITANMPAGQLYHVRVGTNGGSCSTVSFRIDYNGPAIGCMDINSCNFDPLATVSCSNCCLAPGDPNCPAGPDLTINQARLASTLSLSTVNIATSDVCAVQEGCVRGFGQRYVIRFATRIDNIGPTDYYIGSPSSQPGMFNTNNCHGHAHYAGYADYVLFDQSSHAVPVGFKNGYCVMDVGSFGGTTKYGCSNMGISSQCYDEYSSGTTCNWIDITDVPAGTYTLIVRTNWQHKPDALGRHEVNYANNYAQVCLNITRNAQNVPSYTVISGCAPYTDCAGQAFGDARTDCMGTCNGTVKTGDLSNNAEQDQPDAQQYVQRILGDDITSSPCTDLNGDGRISMTDAALLVDCYSQRDIYEAGNPVNHYHPWCDFPRGYLSTIDTADLMIGAFNPAQKYVDIHLKNPTCRTLGYEFDLSGLIIRSVENLAPQLQGDIAWSSTLGGHKVIGLSYMDTTLAKSNAFAPLCRVHYFSLTGAQVCISAVHDIANKDGNPVITHVAGGCFTVNNAVALNVKAFLEGAYETSTGLMRDDLRVQDLLPEGEPYTALGFTHTGGGGGEEVVPSVFAVTGGDAIVDWVLVELRSAADPAVVVATRSALIQRDGDVVGLDGTSSVVMQATPGNYYVALRHRNHLGAMTATAIALSGTAATVDLRSGSTATWGTEARKTTGTVRCLWAGNVYRDGLVKYTGANNDRDPILSSIGGSVPTAVVTGYMKEDVNLSGTVKYTGAANDRDPILVNVGGSIPTAVRLQQLP
ncbi:MAG: hypothetical protein JST66_14960 [Bacteroidetes bacterium]|nr:hypothetical protein [Bacteroidota bacterium]